MEGGVTVAKLYVDRELAPSSIRIVCEMEDDSRTVVEIEVKSNE